MTDKVKQSQGEAEAPLNTGDDENKGKVAGLRRARPCPPNCSKPSVKSSYPFCSPPRCKEVDLSRWLKGGAYAIPAVEQDDPDEDDLGDLA